MDRCHRFGSNRGRREGVPQWGEVDAALLTLIRLVLDDGWSAQRAGLELREKVNDDSVLRRVRIRVHNALAERPTFVAQRAAQTLDASLDDRDWVPASAGNQG